MDNTNSCVILVLIWAGLAIWGIAQIMGKGYLSGILGGVGCVSFILFGWWSIPIILALGPIWLGIAVMLENKRPCPLCKVVIPVSVSVCPNCHRDLPQNWSGTQEPTLPPVSPSLAISAVNGDAVLLSPQTPSDEPVNQPPAATIKTLEKKCTHCGLTNPVDFRFCRECGTPLFAPPGQVKR